jgi:hypothetical protein
MALCAPRPLMRTDPGGQDQRVRRSGLASFDEAKQLIADMLRNGEWRSSKEIHDVLRPRMAEGMFLRLKRVLGIEHRRVSGGAGSYYEWRLTSFPPSSV